MDVIDGCFMTIKHNIAWLVHRSTLKIKWCSLLLSSVVSNSYGSGPVRQ